MKTLSVKHIRPASYTDLGPDFSGENPQGSRLSFNNYYMERDGKPFFPVSGEFHYSRMDPRRWEDELIKMRMGGVNTVATYLFWNHIEEEEGVFDFTGRRDVRRFVQLCRKVGLYVILRVGPFAHGEARNGGLPDWLYGKPFEVRHTNEGFLACVRRLYTKISAKTLILLACLLSIFVSGGSGGFHAAAACSFLLPFFCCAQFCWSVLCFSGANTPSCYYNIAFAVLHPVLFIFVQFRQDSRCFCAKPARILV